MDRILEILKKEGRASAEEIAKRLGLDVEEVRERMRRLEQDKTILGYQAIVNPERQGDDRVIAIIEVKLTPERGTGFDAIAERIYKFPEVRVCTLISGDYDLHVMVEGDSLREVAGFVSERLATLDHVSSTATHFVLKRYKDFGVILHETEKQQRLAISP